MAKFSLVLVADKVLITSNTILQVAAQEEIKLSSNAPASQSPVQLKVGPAHYFEPDCNCPKLMACTDEENYATAFN